MRLFPEIRGAETLRRKSLLQERREQEGTWADTKGHLPSAKANVTKIRGTRGTRGNMLLGEAGVDEKGFRNILEKEH